MTTKYVLTTALSVMVLALGLLGIGLMPVTAQSPLISDSCQDPAYRAKFNTMYRWWSLNDVDHFLTNNINETPLNYVKEDSVGHLISSAELNTTPLYRYYSHKQEDHFYSTSSTQPADYASEGVIGHIFVSNVAGSTPLYRLWRHQGGDHLYTTSAAERDSAAQHGYVFEGIEGYVCPM